MFKFNLLRLIAAAGLVLTMPAVAQISGVDPNTPYQSESSSPEAPATYDYQPVDAGEQSAPESAPVASSETSVGTPATDGAIGPPAEGLPQDDVIAAAEDVFGKGTEGLATMIEKILADQGQPSAYIAGREAGGAFILGVRYGSGTMRHKIEGDRSVYWTGPSIGLDAGADANKVFILVYNLYDGQDLFRRYPAAEGRAYVVGGFTASYLRRNDIVLIPVRLGVGLRLGLNAGYLSFSESSKWSPF